MNNGGKFSSPLVIILILTSTIPVTAVSVPFVIDGYVYYNDGTPCNCPGVTITNLDTGESWYAETRSGLNYYLCVLNSDKISVDDLIEFNVTDGRYYNITNYRITENEVATCGLFNFEIALEGGEQPDLVVTSIKPDVLNNSVNATIKNTGVTDMIRAFNVSLSINGTPIESKMIQPLDAGDNITTTFGWVLPQAGEHELSVIADPDDDIAETNEFNNELTTNITIPLIRVYVVIINITESVQIQELFVPKNGMSNALNITKEY